MKMLQRTLAAAAVVTVGATLSLSAASAQTYYDNGYHNGWNDGWGDRNPSWRTGHRDGYWGYNAGYVNNPAWESGAIDVPVCPPGYHLGANSSGACWPN